MSNAVRQDGKLPEVSQTREARKSRTPMSVSTRLFLWIMMLMSLFVTVIIVVDTFLINYLYIFSTVWDQWSIDSDFDEMFAGEESDYLDKLSEMEKEYRTFIELYDPAGVLVYTSDAEPPVFGASTDQSLVRSYGKEDENSVHFELKGLERVFELLTDPNSDIGLRYFVHTIELNNGYTAKTFKMITPVKEGAELAFYIVIATSVALIFVAIVVVRLFAGRFTKPLKKISSITQNMATLDFSKRCPPANTREIDSLSESINTLSESLSGAIEELKEKNRQLQEDFEKEKQLEEIRNNFITGVSHELKTPIAIIRGYAEGLTFLADTDPAAAKQYSETIVSETERMNDLVMRLLEILKYQSGDYQVKEENFDLAEIVQDWFSRNEDLLASKNISYVNRIPAGLTGKGDSLLISSVVNNYLSNGVSHIDGERVLRADAEDRGDAYRIHLFNTGKPIAQKDIELIWNSFYRADKSLSRAEGRFGLGLTIVASIQNLHGMQYGVENKPDGVSFWFDVKKC